MDLATIRFLADYNQAVTARMDALIAELPEDGWNREFGGYFSSVRSLCNHLCTADFNWLKRFSLLRGFGYIKDEFFAREFKFGSQAFDDKAGYLALRKRLDGYLIRFAAELKDDDLSKFLDYKDSHGDPHHQEFGLVVLHVFNHQTHHRGMVSIYLEEMGVQNDYSNIMDMI